jgi:hypothetical protein
MINWLKHVKEPDKITITGYEAAIVLIRAITKFVAAYSQISPEMDAFLETSREWGFPPLDFRIPLVPPEC